jgi:hypothetical protein
MNLEMKALLSFEMSMGVDFDDVTGKAPWSRSFSFKRTIL